MPYIGRDLNRGNYLKLDDISSSFNSSTKTFNLTVGGSAFTPGSAFSILVSVGGVIQEPESAYQVNNSEITFANAPTAQDGFFCIALGVALGIGVPGNGTVNGTQMAKPFSYDGYFYLDDANNRVGINSSIPTSALDVVGNAEVSGILTATSFSGPIVGNTNNSSGISTFYNLRVSNNLTVEGTTTTLDTDLTAVDRIEVGADSNTIVGVAITQSGTADILNLYDGSTEVFSVADGGNVTSTGDLIISSTLPRITLNDTNHESDFDIKNENGSFRIRDLDNPTDRYRINSSGTIHEFFGAADFNSHLTVDGNITSGGEIKTLTLFESTSGNDLRLNAGSANRDIFLQVNDTTLMTVQGSTDRVGIGTVSPDRSLHLLDTSGGNRIMNIEGTANSGAFLAFLDANTTDDSKVRIGTKGGNKLSLRGDEHHFESGVGTSRAFIDSNGKFGIGDFSSGSVAQALHVKGSEPKIYLEHTGGYDMTLTTSDGMGQNGITVNGGFLSLAYNNKNIVMCRTGGSVGINSTSPREKLDVSGGRVILDPGYQLTWATGTTNRVRIHGDSGSNFIVENGSSNTERLRIDDDGNITNTGISTSFVTTQFAANFAKLDLRGTNIANSNHYILSYGAGHANNQEFHMVNTLGALVFRTGSSSPTEALRIEPGGIIETGTAIGASGADGNQRLRVGRTGDCNIAVRATGSTTAFTGLDFGDQDDDRAGRIQYAHDGNYMSFHTNGGGSGSANERLRITSGGDLVIGGHSSVIEPGGYASHLEILGTGTDAGISVVRYNNSAGGPTLVFGKSRNATIGSITKVQENDNLGKIEFYGVDTDWEPGASIRAFADGEWRSGSVGAEDNTDSPGRLEFHTTPNGSDNLQERLRITSGGIVLINDSTVSTNRADAPLQIETGANGNTLNLRARSADNAYAYINFQNNAGSQTAAEIHMYRNSQNGGQLVFATAANNANTPQTRLWINKDGNVGINRSDPNQRLNVNGNIEVNAYDSANAQGGYYTAKGLIIGNAYDAGKTTTDDRNAIIWQERGLDLDIATNDTLRMKIDYNGEVVIYNNATVGGNHPWAVTGGNYNNLSVSGDNASSSGFLWLGNGASATNADFDLTRINMCNGANIVAQITGTTDTSANDTGRLVFYTRKNGDSSPSKRLSINSTGGLQIFTNTGTHPNVSAFESNHTGSFTSAGMVLNTPAYSEYHYTWSGTGNYTIDLKCGSYFHSEVIYTQHQTNGGNDMQNYARMKWANNHQTHTGYMYEFSGQGTNAAVSTTFEVSDQSGNGSINPKAGLTAAGAPGATFRGQYGGGSEIYDNTSSANGRLRISETYNGSSLSASSRCLIVRVYFGSFTITKS